MAPGNQQGTGQKGHWDKTYTDNPTFFGEGPSEFAYTVPSLFKSAGVRSVLELGCGQGRDTLLFAGEGFQVTALDYSETGLLKLQGSAREIGVSDRVATRSFDVRKPLPFPDGSFDACYSHMLLCMELSTEELKFILGEIHRVLKAGGLAFYSVRNTFDKHYRAGLHRSEDMYEVVGGFVVHFFSEEKVRSLSEGYDIQEIRRMQEGGLPRELFAVALKKKEKTVAWSDKGGPENDAGREKEMADMMGKYEDFFHTVYNTGILDKKTKHLAALAASLACGCES